MYDTRKKNRSSTPAGLTELAPVICRRYVWSSAQSGRFSISITSYWFRLDFLADVWTQRVLRH